MLYGQWLWSSGGRKIIVTEGEIDAMTLSQAQNHKWPVVSIKSGAQGAKKDIAKHIEWLCTFDEVIFCYDNDEPGREAANACALLLPPGKAKIAQLPLKDANDMYVEGRTRELIDLVTWKAQPYRPDCIVTIADIREEVLTPPEEGLPWWMRGLTEVTFGRRYGECYALGAGTGVGKTDWLTQQIEFDVNTLNQKVGLFYFEQPPAETVKRIAGKFAGRRFHVPDGTWTQDELVGALDGLEQDERIYLYQHFGVAQWDIIAANIRYLHAAHGVRIFYLDHLTALATGQGDNEREELERIMSEIGSLVQELGIILHFVSHLATPEGKPHEEGGRVTIRHFKGSRAIGFWSFFMFGLERDQQAADPEEAQRTSPRVLKDRITGQSTGKTFILGYDAKEGRLFEMPEESWGETYKQSEGDDQDF